MKKGTVVYWNQEGLGILYWYQPDGSKIPILVHHSAIKDQKKPNRNLIIGSEVYFDCAPIEGKQVAKWVIGDKK